MREIKVRIWDKLNNNYKPGIWEIEDLMSGILMYKDSLIFEEFTGLKDKNGKEIYEGDVVAIYHPFKGRNYKGQVEFIDYGWNVKGFNFTHFDQPSYIFSEGTEYIEIIGNIYENPNLL